MCPRVSDEHKERRRQAILDAAMDVFIGKGYQVATINDISNRCHLSVGAIYRYFAGKGDIMLALVEERLGRTPDLFARLTETAGDPWVRLAKCVDIFISALRVRHTANGRLLLVAMAEAVQDGEVREGLHRRFGALVEYMSGIVADGVAQGLFRPDADPVSLASIMLCVADGVAVYWVMNTPTVDLRAMRTTLLSMLRSYLIFEE